MDITIEYYLNKIAENPNKKHWRVKNAIRFLNNEISSYRFNAMEKVGGQYCQYLMNREANHIEKLLRYAVEQ